MTYRLSERADQDFADILNESLGEFGVRQAAQYRAGLERTFELLAEHPAITREREELSSRARAFGYKAHMIVYREEDDGILIIRLPHARSDWINELD